ncbi:MAG: GSCFA domain-containing protein [Flammeovirgaceae bacterium]|nr:MAG: GSCFA domain-containing protein [Flammeovirgaceae bacterium]
MFRTELIPKQSRDRITLKHRLVTAGSCFADAIGSRLTTHKFECLSNSFGVSYNPHAIHKALLYALHNQLPPERTYLMNQGIHLNYDFHSAFGSPDKDNLKQKLSNIISASHQFLKNANWLLITYGTAWVYTRIDTGEIVANCHKVPSSNFKKELFTQKKFLESFETFYNELLTFNAHINLILTVSPVRHLKDTLEMNSVSKSVLRLTCHTLSERYERVHYFPAFEIMMDDLRDYRFYKSDMIHPSFEAEEYIWQKFLHAFADEPTKKFIAEWTGILQALGHKPFHPASAAHQQFVKDTLKKLEPLANLVNVEKELNQLKAQLL